MRQVREYSFAQLGTLAGTVLGTGLGVLLFALTGEVLFISIAGLGVALGLGIGGAMDRSRNRREDL